MILLIFKNFYFKFGNLKLVIFWENKRAKYYKILLKLDILQVFKVIRIFKGDMPCRLSK